MGEGPGTAPIGRWLEAGTAPNLGELGCPCILDPKPGSKRQESTAIVCGPPGPAHAHGEFQTPRGQTQRGRRECPSCAGAPAEGKKSTSPAELAEGWREERGTRIQE